MEFLIVDWFCWFVIALSILQLIGVLVLIKRIPPHQEVIKSKATHPFFVPEDGRNIK